MLIELSDKILDALKTNGLEVRDFSYKDLIDKKLNLIKPAVNVDISRASAAKVAINTYKYRLEVSLIIVFQYLPDSTKGARRRKQGIYELVEAIAKYLTLQKFGLELENPLIPESFRNITTYELALSGYSLYNMVFWCSYLVRKQDEFENAPELRGIIAKYFIEPDETTLRAEDDIVLS